MSRCKLGRFESTTRVRAIVLITFLLAVFGCSSQAASSAVQPRAAGADAAIASAFE